MGITSVRSARRATREGRDSSAQAGVVRSFALLGASLILGLPQGLDGQSVSGPGLESRPAAPSDRAEVLAIALEDRLPPLTVERLAEGPFLIDTVRTATQEADREELLRWLADRIGAGLGNVEEHCVRIRDQLTFSDATLGLPQRAVRPAALVVAADIVEWDESERVVRVTHWQGQGVHTGHSVELRVERAETGWKVTTPLIASSGACIRGEREPLEVALTELDMNVLRGTEVGYRIFLSFLDSISVWVEGGLMGVVPEELKDLVWEHGAVGGEVIEVSVDPPSVRILVR